MGALWLHCGPRSSRRLTLVAVGGPSTARMLPLVCRARACTRTGCCSAPRMVGRGPVVGVARVAACRHRVLPRSSSPSPSASAPVPLHPLSHAAAAAGRPAHARPVPPPRCHPCTSALPLVVVCCPSRSLWDPRPRLCPPSSYVAVAASGLIRNRRLPPPCFRPFSSRRRRLLVPLVVALPAHALGLPRPTLLRPSVAPRMLVASRLPGSASAFRPIFLAPLRWSVPPWPARSHSCGPPLRLPSCLPFSRLRGEDGVVGRAWLCPGRV